MPDKLGPVEIEFVLDKQADEQAKKLKASLDAVGTSSKKSVADLKVSIKEQKEFIKGLIAEIKNLERAAKAAHETATDTAAGIARQNAMNVSRAAQQELASAQKQLGQEKETLNRLQNETIAQNKEEETSQGKIIESLKKWGMGLLTITGAIKVFKAIVASSNVLTEEFGFAVDGAKGALQQFFQVFSAGAGQTGNPIANMIKGFKGSKELSQNIDLYNDSMRANQVLEAQEIETLKQKEAIFRNASNSAKQREAALNDWITIRKEAAARELKIEQDLNTALLNEIKNRPNLKGITDQEIGGFVTMYAKNPELMQKAEDLSKLYSGMAEWDTADKIAKLRKEIEQLLPKGITFESLMSSIRLNSALSDKQIDALAESYKRLATAQGGGAQVEAETARWMGSIINKGEAADKKLNDLKTQIDTLKTSLETAGESERKGIADKIILLEKELKLQVAIANAALMAATIRETPPSKITGLRPPTLLPGGLKIPNTLAGKPTIDSGDYIPGTAMLSAAGKARQKSKDAEYDKDAEKSLKNQLDLRNQIVKAATDLVMQLGQQIGLSQEEMQLLGGTLDAFTKLATGDLPGAAISMLSGLMAMIPNEAEKFALQIEHINNLIAQQQRLVDQSDRKGGKDTAVKDLMELRKQQKADADEQVRIAEINLKDKQGFMFGIGIGVNAAKKKLEEAKQAAIEAGNSIEDLQQEYDDFMRGGITENTIADSITQAFQDGKTSVDDLGNYANKVLSDAVLNIFKQKLLDDPAMKVWMEEATAAFNNPELTQEQKDKLKADYVAIGKKYEAWYNNMTSGFTDSATQDVNSLSGAIKGITEETASVLAGQVNAIRISQATSNNVMQSSLKQLMIIANNTDYCKYLKSIDEKIGALKTDSLRAQGML